MVVLKPIIKRKKKDKGVKTLTQKIIEVHENTVTVVSRKGNEYSVVLSKKLQLRNNISKGDMAVIKISPDNWMVIDIIYNEKEPELSPEEEQLEIERQIQEYNEIFGIY